MADEQKNSSAAVPAAPKPAEEKAVAKPKKKVVKKKVSKEAKIAPKPESKVKEKAKAKPKTKEEAVPLSERKQIHFTEKPEKRHKTPSSPLAMTLAFLLFVGIVGAAWYYQTQQLSRKTQETTSGIRNEVSSQVDSLKEKLQNLTDELEKQKQDKQAPPMSQYANGEIGIQFSYPPQLGDVVIDPQTATKKDETIKTVTITFSKNPDIWIIASSGNNDSKDIPVYNGTTAVLTDLCKNPLEISKQGYCDMTVIANQSTVERTVTMGEDQVTNIVRAIPLNLPGSAYKGLSINVNLGLPPVTGRSIFAPTKDSDQQDALEEYFRHLVKRDGLSLIVAQNLDAHKAILDSLALTK